jgi:hypothetical protein
MIMLGGAEHVLSLSEAEDLREDLSWATGVADAFASVSADKHVGEINVSTVQVALEYLRQTAQVRKQHPAFETLVQHVVAAAKATGATPEQIAEAIEGSVQQ